MYYNLRYTIMSSCKSSASCIKIRAAITIIEGHENHRGLTHKEYISIWEYSNIVFQKLLMIYVFGSFTSYPLEFC